MNTARTPLFLMANLGSEVSQVFSYAEKGELKFALSARERADRIIAELLAHPDMKGRGGEIEILREVVEDLFAKERRFSVNKNDMDEYFMPFALSLMSV